MGHDTVSCNRTILLWGNQSVFDPDSYVASLAPTVNPNNGTLSGGDPYNGVVIPGRGFPGSGTFGQVTSKGVTYPSERQLQFSLRYQF